MAAISHLNTIYEIPVEVLTPIHVGVGQDKWWIKNMDFFQDRKKEKIYVIEQTALFKQLLALGEQVLNNYTTYLSENRINELESYLQKRVDFSELATLTFDYASGNTGSEIHPVWRDGTGTPTIPGSSIKGAIRSVVLEVLYARFTPRSYSRYTESELLGSFEMDIMRYIQPADVKILETEIVNIDLFNLYNRGINWESDYKNKNNPFVVLETFAAKRGKGTFHLGISDGFITQIADVEKRKTEKLLPKNLVHIINRKAPLQTLFNIINEYTFKHLEKEIAFFKKYDQAADTDIIIEHLSGLQAQTVNNPNYCILRLAAGSGFHGITGDWRFKDHTSTIQNPDKDNLIWQASTKRKEPTRYKSRKIADNGDLLVPMGFLKLSLPEGLERIAFKPRPDFEKKITTEATPKTVNAPKAPAPVVVAKAIDASTITSNQIIFYAEIVKLGKPFSDVTLLLDNYNFDKQAQLSGTKGVTLKVGQIVKVVINSRNSEGKITAVKYMS